MTVEGRERLGPYVLLGELGRGGMGVVLRGQDPAGRAVAIKRLVVREEQLARRLLREADVRIEHTNVVKVLGAGLDGDGEPYVVTELLEGETLAAVMARKPPVAVLVDLFAQAADGLAAIHARGVIHRDVKPTNLFVTRHGVLKVLDFGIATAGEGRDLTEASLTATGTLLGTPAYISPEQARGARSVDGRADLWSLGMSLYEALTGVLPFRRDTVIATALAVQLDPLPRVVDHAPDVTFELAALVERCLSREPDRRPTSGEELAAMLRAVPVESLGRPSQPLVAASDPTWREVFVVLLRGIEEVHTLRPAAERADALLVPVLHRAAAMVLGGRTSRGDELERAIDLALSVRGPARAVVVGATRMRAASDPLELGELDVRALAPALALLEVARGDVLSSPEVTALLSPSVTVERRNDGVARVLARGSARTERESACVGRDAELAVIEERVRRAVHDRTPQVLSVIAETGLGKTALLTAIEERASRVAPGVAALRVDLRRDGSTPLGSLSAALGVELRAGESLQRTLDARRMAVLDALGERLVDASAVVLLVDDADIAEPSTATLLRELPSIFEGRALVLVTSGCRPEAESTVDRDVPHERLVLTPLPASLLRSLVEGWIAPATLDAPALNDVLSRAGGNPLFAEHLARSVVSAGRAPSGLPPTLASAVQAQLDRLPEELSSAVRSLAVFSDEGDAAGARAALGTRAGALVARLEEAGVLMRGLPAGRWRFHHRVVAEVAYAAIDAEQRQRLHRELAQRMAASPEAAAERVLDHADRGGDVALAARYVREAFFHAAERGDGRRALELAPRVREPASEAFPCLFLAAQAAAFVRGSEHAEAFLVDALAHARDASERALARIELAEHVRRRGGEAEAKEHLDRALEEVTSPAVRARALCRRALLYVSEGALDRAVTVLTLPELGELPVALSALVWDTRGYVHGARGALGPRRRAYEKAAALYAEAGDGRRAAGAHGNLGDTQRAMGDWAAAERTLRRAIEGARKVGNGLTEAYALANLAAVLIALSRRREALATLEVAQGRAIAVGDRRLSAMIALYRAQAERHDVSDQALSDAEGDPTQHAVALALRIEHGAPSERELDAAEAMLAGEGGIEEGVLELGRALLSRRGTERVRDLVRARVERTASSIDEPAWAERFRRTAESAIDG